MPISANTVFHFTSDKNSLRKILEESFRVFFCKERLELDKNNIEYYVPMVSFCEIPLSQIKDHISKYGNYGIGLTREWAVKNALNPVLYLEKASSLAKSYDACFNYLASNSVTHPPEFEKDFLSNFSDVLRYLKNYEADLWRKGMLTVKNYRFADEREWRFVPPVNSEIDMFLSMSEFSDSDLKRKAEEKLGDLRLELEPNDIKFIIINDDDEIGDFINHLRSVKGGKYSLHDIERLTTRIFTTKQIKEDI